MRSLVIAISHITFFFNISEVIQEKEKESQEESESPTKQDSTPEPPGYQGKTSTPQSPAPTLNLNVTTMMDTSSSDNKDTSIIIIEPDMMDHIIGTGGRRINSIQKESNATITLKQLPDGQGKLIVTGTTEEIKAARRKVDEVVTRQEERIQKMKATIPKLPPSAQEIEPQQPTQLPMPIPYPGNMQYQHTMPPANPMMQHQLLQNQMFQQQQMLQQMQFLYPGQQNVASGTEEKERMEETEKLEKVRVEREVAAYIIGKEGETIKDIGIQTKTTIRTDASRTNYKMEDLMLDIKGKPRDVEYAVEIIRRKIRTAKERLRDRTENSKRDRTENSKQTCHFYQEGRCRYGDRCKKAHSDHGNYKRSKSPHNHSKRNKPTSNYPASNRHPHSERDRS